MADFTWLSVARRVQAIAKTGLHYTESDYDRERYQELYELSLKMLGEWSDTKIAKAKAFFNADSGYITPKVDVRGIVFRGDTILMVHEKQDGKWALPGGWADVNYSPKEVAAKEVWEEAGLEVSPIKLLGIFDKLKHAHPPDPIHAYKLFILCEENGGSLQTGSETLDAGFYSLDQLPELSTERNTYEQIRFMFEQKEAGYNLVPWLD